MRLYLASDWSILPHHWPLIGRHWLSCDPWWQVAARRRMVVSDSDSSGVTLATSEPLTSGWGHKLAPMLWWSVPEPFHGAGMLVSHQMGEGERCQGYMRCGDGDSCGISSRLALSPKLWNCILTVSKALLHSKDLYYNQKNNLRK